MQIDKKTNNLEQYKYVALKIRNEGECRNMSTLGKIWGLGIEVEQWRKGTQISRFMGPTWGPPGSCRPQMGPMLAPWTLSSGELYLHKLQRVLSVWHWQAKCSVLANGYGDAKRCNNSIGRLYNCLSSSNTDFSNSSNTNVPSMELCQLCGNMSAIC